ncbi:putative mannosyltransferase [alpha proteobacterium BAL199]|nr:putative mannosyltransferase [alpha proteobacterium BAL199]
MQPPYHPILVHAIGWFDGRYGYNVHTRGLFDALSRRVPVVATPVYGKSGPIDEDKAAVASHFAGRSVATVALMYGSLMGVLDGVLGPKVAYTVWEATRLPDDWFAPLAAADRIWTATAWGKRVFAANGFDPDRIDVIPEGVDPALFHPDVAPTEAFAAKPFKFLAIGRWEHRKGMAELVRAFDQEFGDQDDAILVLAGLLAGLYAGRLDLDLGRELRALRLRRPDRLKIVPPVDTHRTFAGIYTACDAFVAPARAEGWGLPVIEAMACGLPTIVTGYSGPTEFIGEHAWRIDHRLVPVDEPFFERADGDLGFWAEPDWAHLRSLMREIFESRATARERARAGSEHVRRNFSWDRAATVAQERLQSLFESR